MASISGCLKPWPHRASVSALTPTSMLVNGYDADAWYGLYKYKLMWAITSVNADARCGQGLRRVSRVGVMGVSTGCDGRSYRVCRAERTWSDWSVRNDNRRVLVLTLVRRDHHVLLVPLLVWKYTTHALQAKSIEFFQVLKHGILFSFLGRGWAVG